MSSPLVDWASGLMNKYRNADTKRQEADPGMVKEANESFRKADSRKKLSADGPRLGGKKKSTKKTKRKQESRKKD